MDQQPKIVLTCAACGSTKYTTFSDRRSVGIQCRGCNRKKVVLPNDKVAVGDKF